jgi:ABC-2 type transport system ATP-binding protein
MNPFNENELLAELKSNFKVGKAQFKSLADDLKLSIQIKPNESPNDLLQYLITKSRVNHFVEVVPSVNDIFIKTVTRNE